MYSVGDIIIYGGEGVCKVERIEKMNIKGLKNDKLYYYLTPLYHNGTIYAPTDSPVRMRSVISKDEAEKLIERIPEIPAETFPNMNVRLLSEHYQSIIKSYECEDLVRVIKTIETKKNSLLQKGKRLGTVEERFLNRAEDILWGELSVSLGIDKNDVDNYIRERNGV